MKGLSIIIPTYNEKKNLKILIPKIYSKIKIKKFEILIVDDDSKDGTKQLLNKMLLIFKNLKYSPESRLSSARRVEKFSENSGLKTLIIFFKNSLFSYFPHKSI